jgi:cytosine/adenosine deaminase-related metal-dependent hydrolase
MTTSAVSNGEEFITAGMVCAHHHLYSSLARGMPAPPQQPHLFRDVLEQVWWRLDAALDLEMIYWSAALGAMEALSCGTTAIIDHHESPFAIEGSLETIARACDMVGVRVLPCYGVTDRWNDDAQLQHVTRHSPMTQAARSGLAETKRFIETGRPAMVGVHAAFTCGDETLQTAADLAVDLDVGVHIHVAEGPDDRDAADRIARFANDKWLLIHAVNLTTELPGTIVHNPRSNMNNRVGYARPAQWNNRTALGTDGIGADMLEEFRLAYVAGRADDITFSPDTAWSWLNNGYELMPEARQDRVTWNYDHVTSPWHSAFTTGIRAVDVDIAGNAALRNGVPTNIDVVEIRSKAAEQARRLHLRLQSPV